MSLLRLWLCLAVLAACALAQGGSQNAQKCIKCRSTGMLPCSEHPKEECAWEREVLCCTLMSECAVCKGTGYVDCPACTDEAAEKQLGARVAALPKLREGLRKYETDLKRPLRIAESDHFVVIWDIDEQKVGTRRLRAHELLHLYVRRLEAMRKLYMDTLHADERDFKVKCLVMVWSMEVDHRQAGIRYCQLTGEGGVKLMGIVSNYSVCGAKKYFRTDDDLHCDIVHNVAHLLLAHQDPSRWIGNLGCGWADEGLAHWCEDKLFGRCATYCFEEQLTGTKLKVGAWKPAVRKLAEKGDLPGLPSLLTLNTENLSPQQHMVSFSVVDYLIAQDGAKFNALCKLLRQRKPSRDALAEVYHLAPLQLQEQWRKWVLDTYPVIK